MANMFGALNRFIARLDSDPNTTRQLGSSASGGASSNAYGFQVVKNAHTDLQLEPWFDFIIGINHHSIDNGDPNLLATEIRNCAGSTISLGVYGAKGQQIRELYAPIPADGSSLGLSLQWAPLSSSDDVWHILDVMPNSPADVAGLLPYSDYVIGSPERSLQGESALGDLVEAFLNAPLRLWVYNHEYDVTRMVTITPVKSWGGDGALGCVLGYGALHRVPAPLTEPSQAPGETLFESSDDFHVPATDSTSEQSGQNEFLVPANLQFPNTSSPGTAASPPPPPPPPPGASAGAPPGPPAGKARKQRAHHTTAPVAGLDDYFAEGEQKSREMEGGGSTPKPSSSLPPPPKGGPPRAATPAE